MTAPGGTDVIRSTICAGPASMLGGVDAAHPISATGARMASVVAGRRLGMGES
jgi:hypothetical protein